MFFTGDDLGLQLQVKESVEGKQTDPILHSVNFWEQIFLDLFENSDRGNCEK